MISLYDTARGQVAPLKLRDPGRVSMYVCGPTVYGPPHIGHGRQTLVYDILRRFLTWSGLEVTFVSNVTDIDDKIINRAADEDREWTEIATKCEAIWWKSMDSYNVLRPDHTPHATEYVEEMVDLIGALIAGGSAYVTTDGVYLRVSTVPDYGLLTNQNLDDLLEGGGERSLVGTEKESPADFVLWKFSKPGEPAWPSPWGEGRPGWHTECVVMSLDLLGEGFDLHTGGLDLVFPHHENERAQAVANGQRFARHWMHHGFVELEGEKMSKSLGNVKNLLDLAQLYDPRAYRLLILQSHYRSPIEVTDTSLNNAVAALGRLDSFARRAAALATESDPTTLSEFRSVMENDLDTAGAVDLMFRKVRETNSLLDSKDIEAAGIAAATALEIATVLGLELNAEGEVVPEEVAALVVRRTAARAAKDWAEADEIRDELTTAGWTVEDGAQGPVPRRL
ncbi:MAG: cysteine--tRNA ligase [Acidimicrobiales bacterium]|nr:cysteine--tRNA ligase [Acidimicrobiales bacterium]